MKVSIKKLNGTQVEIEVKPQDTVADVKKIIETDQGENAYPAAHQILIHRGKILKDGTTLKENNVAESNGIVILVSPQKSSRSSARQLPAGPLSETNTPEAAPNTLDFLRNSRHFLPLRAMMLSNRRTLVPILAEIRNQNLELSYLICDNVYDLLRLLYKPLEGSGSPLNLDSIEDEDEGHPRNWTSEESLAIDRLEALGFDRNLVSEVFYSCNKDEDSAAAFLSSHMNFKDED